MQIIFQTDFLLSIPCFNGNFFFVEKIFWFCHFKSSLEWSHYKLFMKNVFAWKGKAFKSAIILFLGFQWWLLKTFNTCCHQWLCKYSKLMTSTLNEYAGLMESFSIDTTQKLLMSFSTFSLKFYDWLQYCWIFSWIWARVSGIFCRVVH